jgi:hypothetical protein
MLRGAVLGSETAVNETGGSVTLSSELIACLRRLPLE